MNENRYDPTFPEGTHGVQVRLAPHPDLPTGPNWVVTVDGYNLCRCWTQPDADKIAEDLWRLRDLER